MDNPKSKPTTSKTAPKRHRSELSSSDPDSDLDSTQQPIQTTLPEWPRFLVVESLDNERPLTKLSPFAIAKAVQGLAGEPKSIKKLNSGQLLIECNKRAHSVNLLSAKSFVDIPIKVTAHRTMNTCKGVVRSRDLEGTSDEEMVSNLKPQGVIEARRIHVRRGEIRVATNTFILTFSSPTLPSSIKAGFIHIPVDHYIPNPLRCFKCQRFGHHKDKCRREAVCGRCGQSDHDETSPCTRPTLCTNCNGSHTAFDRNCPKWLEEKEVQRVKTVHGISFPDARKLVESRAPTCPLGKTYANVAKVVEPKTQCKSVETQTDITWPYNAKNFTITRQPVPPPKSSSSPAVTSLSTQTLDQSLQGTKDDSSRKNSPRKGQKITPNRAQKGSDDPVQQHNRFGALMDMDTTEVSKPRRQKPEPPPSKPTISRLPTKTPP